MCDIRSKCKEHTEFIEGESECCGAPPYNVDYEPDCDR